MGPRSLLRSGRMTMPTNVLLRFACSIMFCRSSVAKVEWRPMRAVARERVMIAVSRRGGPGLLWMVNARRSSRVLILRSFIEVRAVCLV